MYDKEKINKLIRNRNGLGNNWIMGTNMTFNPQKKKKKILEFTKKTACLFRSVMISLLVLDVFLRKKIIFS